MSLTAILHRNLRGPLRGPFRPLSALLLLALCSCGAPREARPVLPSLQGGVEAALAREVGASFVSGNSVELINNGRVFDVIEAEIAKAQRSVNIEMFIWRPSAPSDRLVDALLARTRHGVTCRVVVEAWMSNGFAKEVRPRLEAGGCQVRFHDPVKNLTELPDKILERNHRKTVVVDGKVGITGGFGVWKSWEGNGHTEPEWRDVAVKAAGPVVRQMQLGFAENWRSSGGGPLTPDDFPEIEPVGSSAALYVISRVGPKNAALRMTHVLVRAAKRRLWIANSYFVPSNELSAALISSRSRGVDVRVLGPGDRHDLPPILAGQRASYPQLRDAEVRIFEYAPSMMHSKTMIVDDDVAVVGSINLDPLSLEQLDEGALVVSSPELVQQMEADFLDDLNWSREIQSPRASVGQQLSRSILWFLGRYF